MTDASPPLADIDDLRLTHLFERTFGTGFKLVFIEVATPVQRHALLDYYRPRWTQSQAKIIDIDVAELTAVRGERRNINLWDLLRERFPKCDPKTVLVFHDIETADYESSNGRSALLQQINVQRDILVRDFPCWWVVCVHPRSRERWLSVAPDFCDFAALWVEGAEAPGESVEGIDVAATGGAEVAFVHDDWPEELRRAWDALLLGMPAQAADIAEAFAAGLDARAPDATRSTAILDLIQARLAADRGDIDVADRILQDKLLVSNDEALESLRADARGLQARLLILRGNPEEALRIHREERLPVYARLDKARETAATMGEIADILGSRGEFDEAMRIYLTEVLPVCEQLGDVRVAAVARERIAGIFLVRGRLEVALDIYREDVLPVYEQIGDLRGKASAMGKIADILQARGHMEEALRIRREEQLPLYERLGDVRLKGITLSKIADMMQRRGDFDEAMRIRIQEELPIFERLGDVHGKAVTMGNIANIFESRGQLDEASRILREDALPVFMRLGNVRSLVVGRTHLAQILAMRGRPEDRPEVRHLLSYAYADASRLLLPSAAQIRAIYHRIFGQDPPVHVPDLETGP